MSHSYLKTRTARYFINKYKRSTLRESIELAARKEREVLLPGMEGCCKIPVDVEGIAQRRGIILNGKLPADDQRDATILASGELYSVKMALTGTPQRDRFSLAHEIGHTLFLSGAKHDIGVLSREEIEAEEYICNMFAEALLMPQEFISEFVSRIPFSSPWSILMAFENACRQLKVSLPALVTRIGHVKTSPRFSFIALCLRYFANKYTGEVPCLRVAICSPNGDWRHTRTWNNKSATGLQLLSANDLFTMWRSDLPIEGEPSGGRYVIDNYSKVPASIDSLKWIEENIQLSICRAGKWYKEMIPTLITSCLYARQGWKEDNAYIISIIKPKER